MKIELSEHQREILAELLEVARKDKVHELHRTDSLGYKAMLREKIVVIDELCAMISASQSAA